MTVVTTRILLLALDLFVANIIVGVLLSLNATFVHYALMVAVAALANLSGQYREATSRARSAA